MRTALLLSLIVAHAVPGQLTSKVESASQLYVYATQAGVGGKGSTWPSGKDLGKRFRLSANFYRYGNYTANYWTVLQPLGLDVTRSATFPINDGYAKGGPNDVIWTIVAPKARTARLTMETTVFSQSRSRLTTLLWVDIGADGSFEYQATQKMPSWSKLVSVGPKPLKILIRTRTTWNWWSGSVITKLRLSRQTPCDTARFGKNCGTIQVDGPFPYDLERMHLSQVKGRPNVLGALVAGTTKISVPLPGGSGCRLYTDPAFVHFYRTNALGHALLILPIPQAAPSFANLQLLNAFDKNGVLHIDAAQAASVLCR